MKWLMVGEPVELGRLPENFTGILKIAEFRVC
jgi:hypothetical protein